MALRKKVYPTGFTALFDRVEIQTVNDTGSDRFIVQVYWKGVDRTAGSGWSCGSNRKLAERLAKCIKAGKAITDPEVKTDIYGETYVGHGFNILMRQANADMKRLGF